MTQVDQGLIAEIEQHRTNVREFGRDCRQSSYSTVMSLLVKAGDPIDEARDVLKRLGQVNTPGGCFSAGQGAHLAGVARDLEQRLADLHARGGPHEALLGLIRVAYRQLAAPRSDRVLRPEEDAAITDALERYATQGGEEGMEDG